MCISEDQSQHEKLRNNVLNHLLAIDKEFILLSNESIRKNADTIRVNCSRAGEDATMVTANYLKRNISILFYHL